MIIRKVVFVTVALCLAMFGAVQAGEQNLSEATRVYSDVYGQDNIANMMKGVKLLKDAGLSYQKSLVIPLEEVAYCKDQEGLRVLMGMYTFDANYALVFGKWQVFMETLEVNDSQVRDRLDSRDKFVRTPMKPELLKALLDDPENMEKREAWFDSIQGNIDATIKQAGSDPEIMEVVVDSLYGSIIEGLYIVCELALNNEGGEEMIALFNAQAKRVNDFDTVFHAFKDPKLIEMVGFVERDPLLHIVKDLINSKKGDLDRKDIETILAQVKPVRDSFVGTCQ